MEQDGEYLRRLGERLKELRSEKGYSQQELADLSNVAKSTVQRIETGSLNPTILVLRKIAETLSVQLENLLPHTAN